MLTEVEIKFAVNGNLQARLASFLQDYAKEGESRTVTLLNTYYDTPNRLLRQHHFGLRTREVHSEGNVSLIEMTLKSEGRVIGGLHSRPEYNVTLTTAQIDLALLPADIWPQSCQPAEIAAQLHPLFTTNFDRTIYLVNVGDSVIELAYDRGEIRADEAVAPINEVELELKSGELADLLTFARALSAVGDVRLFDESKAKRGYQLSEGSLVMELSPFTVPNVKAKATVEDAIITLAEHLLRYWQMQESAWLTGHKQGAEGVRFALSATRQLFTLFGGIIPRKASHELRAELIALENAVQEASDAESFCYQPAVSRVKLMLMQWLAQKQWQQFVRADKRQKLTASFKRFADTHLSRYRHELKTLMQEANSHQAFLDKATALEQGVISLVLLAGAYPQEASQAYVGAWLALLECIEHHDNDKRQKLLQEAINQPTFWLTSTN